MLILNYLQTASVVAGLPYTVILCFVTISMWRALAMEHGDLDPYGPDFAVSLIDPFTRLQPKLWLRFLKNIFITYVMIAESNYSFQLLAFISHSNHHFNVLSYIKMLSIILPTSGLLRYTGYINITRNPPSSLWSPPLFAGWSGSLWLSQN